MAGPAKTNIHELADGNGDGRALTYRWMQALCGVFFALGQADGTFGPVTSDLQSIRRRHTCQTGVSIEDGIGNMGLRHYNDPTPWRA